MENEAIDGESLARSEAVSQKGCEYDGNNSTLKSTEKEN